jgi:hypothetical protein
VTTAVESARTQAMRDGEFYVCPPWCTQPADEDGWHISDWRTYTTQTGAQIHLRATATWDEQGVGGPGFVHVWPVMPGEWVALSEDDWSAFDEIRYELQRLIDRWHVYHNGPEPEDRWAYPGAEDDFYAAQDAEVSG